MAPSPTSPYRHGTRVSPSETQRRWRTPILITVGLALASALTAARRARSVKAPEVTARSVTSMARGRGRLLLVASDGTAWSIPERGVEVGGERRLLPVRERFDDVRALAETGAGLWALGRDGRVRLRPDDGGDAPAREMFGELSAVSEMAALGPPDEDDRGDPAAEALVLLGADGTLRVRAPTSRDTQGTARARRARGGGCGAGRSKGTPLAGASRGASPTCAKYTPRAASPEPCSTSGGTMSNAIVGPGTQTRDRLPPSRRPPSPPAPDGSGPNPRSAVGPGAALSACALSASGALRCAGRWRADGARISALGPVAVLPGRRVTSMASAGMSTCALDAEGAVWCWGGHASHRPTRVPDLPRVAQIASRGDLCARTHAGTLHCWDFMDERWAPQRVLPELLPTGEVTALDVGAYVHGLVITQRDGSRWRIDQNCVSPANFEFDQQNCLRPCRNGSDCRPPRRPRLPDEYGHSDRYDGVLRAIGPVRDAASSGDRACAVRVDGRVVCWSRDGTDAPVEAPDITDALGLVTANGDEEHRASSFCAWSDDGRAWCWGSDRFGQLGDGRHSLDQWATVTLPAPIQNYADR